MNKALGLVTFLALLSTAANAECIRPPKPASLTDGNTATRDEMVAANKLVKQYTAGVRACIDCIDGDLLEYRVKELVNSPYAKFLKGAAPSTQQATVSHVPCNGDCNQMALERMHKNNAAVSRHFPADMNSSMGARC